MRLRFQRFQAVKSVGRGPVCFLETRNCLCVCLCAGFLGEVLGPVWFLGEVLGPVWFLGWFWIQWLPSLVPEASVLAQWACLWAACAALYLGFSASRCAVELLTLTSNLGQAAMLALDGLAGEASLF